MTGPPAGESLWDDRSQQRVQLPPPPPFFLITCLDLASGKARPCTARRGPVFPGLRRRQEGGGGEGRPRSGTRAAGQWLCHRES